MCFAYGLSMLTMCPASELHPHLFLVSHPPPHISAVRTEQHLDYCSLARTHTVPHLAHSMHPHRSVD